MNWFPLTLMYVLTVT